MLIIKYLEITGKLKNKNKTSPIWREPLLPGWYIFCFTANSGPQKPPLVPLCPSLAGDPLGLGNQSLLIRLVKEKASML